MRYIEYKEQRPQGTFDFPIAYYHVTPSHPRYNMIHHWHYEYEIIHILSGEFTASLDGITYLAKEGDILFVSKGVLHGGTPSNCCYECLVFDMRGLIKDNHATSRELRKIFEAKKIVQPYFSSQESGILLICGQLFAAIRERQNGYQLMVQGALYLLFGMIENRSYYSSVSTTPHTIQKNLEQLKDVLSLISDRYQENLTLEDLAGCCAMSPKYFCRFFKVMTQKTPIEYLNYYRIECACEQLTTTNLSITEVALNCGFNDISYFIRVFKKLKNTTPKQYLKSSIVRPN
jgi:AraC-like DNA-binding protein